MKYIITSILIAAIALSLTSCKKDYGNLNSPTIEDFLGNASPGELNNLVSGTESGMRNNLALYLDDVATLGREGYRFSNSEPRYVTDLLGANNATLSNSNFYITNTWASRYRVIKNCNVLIEAATNTTQITESQRKAYTGFALTVKAYQLLLNLNLTYTNGVRIDVSDPHNLGPFVNYQASLDAIKELLDLGRTDLIGATVSFPLAGFNGLNNAEGLTEFNRALAARVSVYREDWNQALQDLDDSFFDPAGSLNTGIYHVFSNGSGDQLNPMFIPRNNSGEIRVAHPSFAADIEPGDDRISKASVRNNVAFLNNLSSDRDVWVYTSSTAPIPIIRNEELLLIFAEASLHTNQFGDAAGALDIIRNAHGLDDYNGPLTEAALTNEMLQQRRYSLYYEGHRWIDLRRYERLNTLPIGRTDDDVWSLFPLPITEQ